MPIADPGSFLGLSTERWSAIGDAATAGTFLVAALAAGVAGVQLWLTRQVRLDQTRPYVMISFEPGITWFQWLDVQVRNVGAGPAHDVRITVDPPLEPARTSKGEPTLAAARYFNEPIPLMPPGYELRTFFDSMIDRHEKGLPERFTFTLKYHDGHGHKFDETIVQDLGIMNDLLFTEVLGMHHAATALQDLAKVMKQAPFANNKPFDVTVEGRVERTERLRAAHAERKARHEEMVARMKNAKAAAETEAPED